MSSVLKKFVYKKPPDGILPIADNIYLLDRSYSLETLNEVRFKAYIENVVSQLHEHAPGGSYMGFNFSTSENKQSQIGRILSEYKITVKEYSRHYEGCPILPLEALHNLLKSSERWLARDRHFLLMHAEQGGWPILAFVLSALLIYLKHYSDEQRTLEMVYKQAPPQLLELFSPLDPKPSQLRYLQYISRRNLSSEWSPIDRAVTLDHLMIRIIPDSDGLGGLRPMFRIYGHDPLTSNDSNFKTLFSTPKDKKTVRLYTKADSNLVKIDICCHIKGDVVLECINTDESLEREEMVFRVMFNTAFIRSNMLMLNRDQLDVMWGAKEHFNRLFRAEILFSDMDLTSPKAKSEVKTEEQYKGEEGLPVEAFSKVREYFGILDWMGRDRTPLQTSQKSTEDSLLQKPEINDLATKSKPKLESDKSTNCSKSLDYEEKIDPPVSSKFEKLNPATHNSAPKSPTMAPNRLRSTSSEISSPPSWLTHSLLSKSRSLPEPQGENLTPNVKPEPLIEMSKVPPKDNPPSQQSSSFLASSGSVNADRLDSRRNPSTSVNEMHHTSSIYTSNSATDVSTSSQKQSNPNVAPPPPPKITSQSFIPSDVPPPPSSASFAPSASPPPPSSASFAPSASPPPPSSASFAPSASPPPPPASPPPNKHTNGFALPPPPPPPPPPIRSATTLSSTPLPSPPPNKSTSGAPSPPPPPPPPTLSSHISVSTRPPPPPPPPLSATKSNTSQAPVLPPPRLPGAPPPPPPPGKSLGNQPNAGGKVQPPPPPSFKGKPLSSLKSPKGTKSTPPKKVSLKPLHWSKVTRATKGSLWAETQQITAPEINFSELETLFAVNVPDPKASGRRASFGAKSEIIHLIELRRSNNCEIMLKNLKIPFPDLVNSVLSLDDSMLEIEQVDALVKFCPTKEEAEMLKNFKGDKEKLGKCEQYFLEIMKVPRFEPKLRILAFKIKFRNQVAELKVNLSIVNAVAEEVRCSTKLKKIMQTILSLGNALNQGTARGSAVGFKLDSLLKLGDTRARDNKTTLMHYLCRVLAEKLPEVLDFSSELIHLEPASKIQLKYLAEGMQDIHRGLDIVEKELSSSDSDGSSSGAFHQTLKEFLSVAEAEVRSLTALYSVVGRNADAMAAYFGEDPAKCPFETVISTLLHFVKTFEKAHMENLKNYEMEKKKAEKEAAERQKESLKHTDSKPRGTMLLKSFY